MVARAGMPHALEGEWYVRMPSSRTTVPQTTHHDETLEGVTDRLRVHPGMTHRKMATVYNIQGNAVRHHMLPQKDETLGEMANTRGYCLGRSSLLSVESAGASKAPRTGGVRVVLKTMEAGGKRKNHDIGVVRVA